MTFQRGVGPPVPTAGDGLRVDLYLAKFYPFRSRNAWREACRVGHLLVNGAPVRASRRLKAGDHLSVFHPPEAEPPVDGDVYCVGQRDGIIAMHKPGNLPMHESGLYWRNTLHAHMAKTYGPEWHAVHRLDRETSGVVLHAATPSLRQKLSFEFESHRVTKTYIAIVVGEAPWNELLVDAPIGPAPTAHIPRGCVRADGAHAVTAFRVLARKQCATLIEAKPRTGRNNQIRIHLAHVGFPILGDKLYHPDDDVMNAYKRHGDSPLVQDLAGAKRHCLHAAKVELKHPETREVVSFCSELPDDLRTLWGS